MSSNVRISLPLNVSNAFIARAAGRMAGAKVILDDKGEQRLDQWEKHHVSTQPHHQNIDTGYLTFKDITGAFQSWLFIALDEDLNPDRKVILPGETPLALVMGKKLVQLFGGSVAMDSYEAYRQEHAFRHSDKDDDEEAIFTVPVEQSTFGPRNRQNNQYWFVHVHESILNLARITHQELLEAKKWVRYKDKDDELIERLRVEEASEGLLKSWKKSPERLAAKLSKSRF